MNRYDIRRMGGEDGRAITCLSVTIKRRCSLWLVSGTVNEQMELQTTMANWQEQVRRLKPVTIIEASCKATGYFPAQLKFRALKQSLKTGKQVFSHSEGLPYGLIKLALVLVAGPDTNLRSSSCPPSPDKTT